MDAAKQLCSPRQERHKKVECSISYRILGVKSQQRDNEYRAQLPAKTGG